MASERTAKTGGGTAETRGGTAETGGETAATREETAGIGEETAGIGEETAATGGGTAATGGGTAATGGGTAATGGKTALVEGGIVEPGFETSVTKGGIVMAEGGIVTAEGETAVTEYVSVCPSIDVDGLKSFNVSTEALKNTFWTMGRAVLSQVGGLYQGNRFSGRNFYSQLGLNHVHVSKHADIQSSRPDGNEDKKSNKDVQDEVGDGDAVANTCDQGTVSDSLRSTGSKTAASDRRSRYRMSGEMWQEQEESQEATDQQPNHEVFDQVPHEVDMLDQGHPDNTELAQGHPDNMELAQGHPDNTELAQGHPDTTELAQVHPDNTELAQGHPDNTESAQVHPDNTESAQGHPDNTELAQGHPDNKEFAQGHPDNTELAQGHTELAQGHPDNMELAQGHPDNTGLAQGHPDNTELAQGHPDNTELAQGHPDNKELAQGHPDNTELAQGHTELAQGHPDNTELAQGHPDNTGLAQGHPDNTELAQGHPDNTELAQVHPDNTELAQVHPDNTELAQGDPDNTELAQGHTELAQGHPDNTELAQVHPDNTELAQGDPDNTELAQGHPDNTELAQGHPENLYRRQTSETGSLPDVILSMSASEFSDISPDLLLSDSPNQNQTTKLDSTQHLPSDSVAASVAVAAERRFQIEGRVHDPKTKPLLARQVSFSTQVSFCDYDNETLRANEKQTPHETFPDNDIDSDDRRVSSSAEDKRFHYSHKTSGYGTGESSKNSTQNTSGENSTESVFEEDDQSRSESSYSTTKVDPNGQVSKPKLSNLGFQSTCSSDSASGTDNNIALENTTEYGHYVSSSSMSGQSVGANSWRHAEDRNRNQPNLSILEKSWSKSFDAEEGAKLRGKQSEMYSSEQRRPDITTELSQGVSKQPGPLPNLSILRSKHDSSFMVSPLNLQSVKEPRKEGDLIRSHTDTELCTTTSSTSGSETCRTPASDNYAMEALARFQRSSSMPVKLRPQLSVENPRNMCNNKQITLATTLTNKAQAQKVQDDLIMNHVEDMLFRLNYAQSAPEEVEKVMWLIKRVVTSESSPSPVTPLTPRVRQAPGKSPRGQKKKRFSFEVHQGYRLRPELKQLQDCLVRSSRCDYNLCVDRFCRKGKKLLESLEKSLLTRPSPASYIDHTDTLLCLFDHSQDCDEFKCPVPWCSILQWTYSNQRYEDIDLRHVTKKLTEIVQYPTMRFTCMAQNEEVFSVLSPDVPNKPAVEGKDWMALVRLGNFGSSVRAIENRTMESWVVKQVLLTHPEADNRLEVYRRLKGHNSCHIVKYLWMKQTFKVLLISSLCEWGGTLHDCIRTYGPFKAKDAMDFFRQVLSAAAFLHNLKILYLYWRAKNIVLNTGGAAKLCNFSTAVYYEGRYDIEELVSLVPATLLSPELLNGQVSLCAKVDSWGLGCLLTELVTGISSRQDLIHEDRTQIEHQIRQSPRPKQYPDNPRIQQILNMCWKVNPTERHSAAELKSFCHQTEDETVFV